MATFHSSLSFAEMSSNFEEKSGLVTTQTPWGNWGQTIEDLFIEVHVDPGTTSKEIKCELDSSKISVSVKGKILFSGVLYSTIVKDESIWTLEDKKMIRIVLNKMNKTASSAWKSLFVNGEYAVDQYTFDEMEKKLTLERFQNENPGFDFSKAQISGNYQSGGPQFKR